eukprot:6352317-Amphidinium_carterae.1
MEHPIAWKDAVAVEFSQGAHLAVEKAGSYKADRVYCVAPVIPGAEDAPQEVGFWAVGTDCCEDQHCSNEAPLSPKSDQAIFVVLCSLLHIASLCPWRGCRDSTWHFVQLMKRNKCVWEYSSELSFDTCSTAFPVRSTGSSLVALQRLDLHEGVWLWSKEAAFWEATERSLKKPHGKQLRSST